MTRCLATPYLESGVGRKSPQPGPPALNSNDSGSVVGVVLGLGKMPGLGLRRERVAKCPMAPSPD